MDDTVAHDNPDRPTRRDLVFLATGAMSAVGAAAAVWPFISFMAPDASVQAPEFAEAKLDSIKEGEAITIRWRGLPIVVRHRTAAEIDEARKVNVSELKDPFVRHLFKDNALVFAGRAEDKELSRATDDNLTRRPEWLVAAGVCTYDRCVVAPFQGDYKGWFCPCDGSHYDTSGRIRRGLARRNLPIPPYTFVSDSLIRIG